MPYLGYLFDSKISESHYFRQQCQNYLISLYKQLKQSLSDNFAILKNVSIFSVNNVINPIKDLPKYSKVMEYLGISGNILCKAESQLQSINLVKWNNDTETEKFWSEVMEFKDASR